ncbi:MAG TPA: glycosyltransferase [Bacteroidia bacterium]
MKKDCLVIFTPGFPDGEQDTRCMPYIQLFLKGLIAAYPNLTVQVISFQYPFESKSFEWNSCKVFSIGGKNKKWNRLFVWKKAKNVFADICKNNSVIGVLSLWLTESTYIAAKVSKKYNIPHISWALGQDVKKNNRYISRINFSHIHIAALSPFSKEQLQLNHNIEANSIISCGIHEPGVPKHTPQQKEYDIISVGSLSDFKRFDWIVDCVAALKEKCKIVKACMIGDGPEYVSIKEKINKLGLQDVIELKGSLPHNECLSLMMRSKILLHPSSFEGGPMVVLEALYYGCYVVSATVPHEQMPATFFKVNTLQEMITKTEELLHLPDNETSYCVTSSVENAKKLMKIFNY